MFESATLKLTGWYLLILMTISLLFSGAIYQLTTAELGTRLENFQNKLQIESVFIPRPIDTLRIAEATEAQSHMFVGLLYANLLILIGGGIVSYFLARRTLRPIEIAHEAQSRFTSDASHELRTPLASMKTELEVILRDSTSTKKDFEAILRSNLEEVEKLTKLSEMLLNLSRLDHDKLERSAVDLRDVTRDVLARCGKPESRISVSASKQSVVEGNDAAITELIMILVDNALKYSPEDSHVDIVISRNNRYATFVINNTGPGIEAAKLPYIFDRFYRADTSRTNQSQQGFGLGLSLAKKIVELHGGELRVMSTPGAITTFTFMLPVSSRRS